MWLYEFLLPCWAAVVAVCSVEWEVCHHNVTSIKMKMYKQQNYNISMYFTEPVIASVLHGGVL